MILLETYMKTHSLIDFEVAMDKFISTKYVQKIKEYCTFNRLNLSLYHYCRI